jgi:anti-anti-sigma factor
MIETLRPPITTVTLAGEIDIATSPAVRQALMAAIEAGRALLAVDMAGVTFIDASGVNALLAAARLATEAGGGLSLLAPSQQVRKIVGILHLDARLPTATLRVVAGS